MILHTSKEVYAHIDCNSFFASCEVLRNPGLKGKCVCVGDQIVIAASYEAKKFGIKTWTPIWEAERILGNKLVKKLPDHSFYREISERLMTYLNEKLGEIEVFSIDELFANVTNMADDYSAFAEDLKKAILHDIGIPVSVGISNTRIRAKMFGDLRKPLGSFVAFDTWEVEAIYKSLAVTEVPYIARGNKELLWYGVQTVYDFYTMNPLKVHNILGKNGSALWLELHGVDSWTAQNTNKKRKSIVCSRSFNHTMTTNPHSIWRQIIMNFERGYETLTSEKQWARVIGVFLRAKDFSHSSKTLDMGEMNIDRSKMLESLKSLFLATFIPGTIYRTTGITFMELTPFTPRQLSIFNIPEKIHKKNEQLSNALKKIKGRYGEGIVRQGFIREKKKEGIGVLFEVG